MSTVSKMMIVVGIVALILTAAPAAPAATTHAAEGRQQTSTSAEKGSFSRCCSALKRDLDRCDDNFENDPEALEICRDAAFAKFDNCTANLFPNAATLFGDAIPPLDACPISLPL